MKRIAACCAELHKGPDSIRNVVDEGSSLNKTVNGDIHANVFLYKQ